MATLDKTQQCEWVNDQTESNLYLKIKVTNERYIYIYIYILFAEIYVDKLDGTQKQNPSIYLKYWVIICKLRFL
jgi:hypothetical protein